MQKGIKNKKILLTVAVIAVIVSAAVCFFVYEGKKPYKEKSEIGFAMGSVVTVKTFGNESDGVESEILPVLNHYDTIILSNKAAGSVISLLNDGKDVVLDDEILSLVEKCENIFSRTDGKAALTVGALSRLWDFDSGESIVPEKEDIENALKTVDDANIQIINRDATVLDGRKVNVINGSLLDLGSVGKGFACDKAAEILEENGVKNAVVAVGGSIYAKGFTAPEKPIRVGVRNPFGNENEYFGYVSASDAFISTSGNYEKFFIKDGVRYHHILDCTTGYPVEGDLVSVTVVCDNGALSDALSTACFVMGYGENTLSLLKDYNAEAIFVFEDKAVKMTDGIEKSFTLTDSSFRVTVL